MSESTASLRRKISSAGDLQSVVRTMKALAASNLGQYEKSVRALDDYYRTVELSLGLCLRTSASMGAALGQKKATAKTTISAVIFGSDQGLVGQFNDTVANYAVKRLAELPGKPQVWAVGERVYARLANEGIPLAGLFDVPGSVQAVTPLVGQIQVARETLEGDNDDAQLYVFYNSPQGGAVYEPVHRRLLPLDADWLHSMTDVPWPTNLLPEVLGSARGTLRALIREYLFITLFRACTESLASENASRLAAMERADKNIDELLKSLHASFHSLRQSAIDAELFDVIAGFEAFSG